MYGAAADPCFLGLGRVFSPAGTERLFRKLYDKVTATAPEQIDFSMNTQPFANAVDGWLKTCCSSTLLAFYGAVFGSAVLVFLHILISGV